jgi:hypothetical protein
MPATRYPVAGMARSYISYQSEIEMSQNDKDEIYRAKMNLETSRIAWKELQRFFASGAAIAVSAELDLVEVAFQISEDNRAQVAQWMSAGQIGRVSDEQALAWFEADADVWAVVVSPYVLVQSAESLQ